MVWEGEYSDILAKQAHIMPSDIAVALMANGDGMLIGKINENGNTVSVLLKENLFKGSSDLVNIGQTPVWGMNASSLPLSAVLRNETMKFEEGQIWRRNRVRTVTVQCDVVLDAMPDTARGSLGRA